MHDRDRPDDRGEPRGVNAAAPDGVVVRAPSDPIHPRGGTAILRVNRPRRLGHEDRRRGGHVVRGTARPFDSEHEAFEALTGGRIKAGDVIVIRYEGPKGSPGMPEMLAVTAAVAGAGLGKDVALITDGRFSGATKGFASATSRPRRSSAVRSRSCARATRS